MAIHQGCSQAFNVPVKYMDTTPDMHLDKIYRCTYQKCVPILVNKQLLTEWLFSETFRPSHLLNEPSKHTFLRELFNWLIDFILIVCYAHMKIFVLYMRNISFIFIIMIITVPLSTQGPIVQRLNNTIHLVNRYLGDNWLLRKQTTQSVG